MNSFTKKLLKLDLLIYAIFSLGLMTVGILMVASEEGVSSTSKNIEAMYFYFGIFTLLIGIAAAAATYIKSKDIFQSTY